MNELDRWTNDLKKSLEGEEFVKLTLSKPVASSDMINVYGKVVNIKGQRMLSLTYHYKTKDIVKNVEFEVGIDMASSWLKEEFKIGTLLTTREDATLRISKKGKMEITRTKASHITTPQIAHDKQKVRIADASAEYMERLGVTDKDGNVIPKMADKFRQINKYLEVMEEQLKSVELPQSLKIVDMGAGKGYLTFALYDYLKNKLQIDATIIGVEQRKDLVDKCNATAEECGFDNLHFELSSIKNYKLNQVDILIALHACDTATDDAIVKGIASKALLIVCAPCCHKQIRQQVKGKEQRSPILKYGIFKEREFEMVTDTIRALLLERNNYKSNVFEFISNEHTRKNIMLVGSYNAAPPAKIELDKKIEAIKSAYQIDFHYLEKQLAVVNH